MAKKVLNAFKRLGHAYMKGMMELYGPVINVGLHPFI